MTETEKQVLREVEAWFRGSRQDIEGNTSLSGSTCALFYSCRDAWGDIYSHPDEVTYFAAGNRIGGAAIARKFTSEFGAAHEQLSKLRRESPE